MGDEASSVAADPGVSSLAPKYPVHATVGGLLAALAVTSISTAMVFAAFGFNTEARRLPIVVGVPTVILATLLLVGETLSLARNGIRTSGLPIDRTFARMMKPLGAFLLFIVSILAFGVMAGTVAFSTVFLRLSGSMRLLPSLLFSFATAAVMYVASVTLQIPLYRGQLF